MSLSRGGSPAPRSAQTPEGARTLRSCGSRRSDLITAGGEQAQGLLWKPRGVRRARLIPCPLRSALVPPPELFTLQQRCWALSGVKMRASAARAQVSGGRAESGFLEGLGGRVCTRGGLRARQEARVSAEAARAGGGGGAAGLRDPPPGGRTHFVPRTALPSWPTAAAAAAGQQRRCWRAAPGFHFYNRSGEGSHAVFLGQGVSSPGRTRRLLVIGTWVTFGNKTRSDRMY